MPFSPIEADSDDVGGTAFAEINVTPLVDVMLVLLVIFMIAAPLLVKGVAVELPKSAGASLGRPADPLIVSLTHDGLLYLGDEKVVLDEIPDRFRALRGKRGDVIVYVRADRGIAYGHVMDVISRLGAGGFTHVSLLSQPVATTDTK